MSKKKIEPPETKNTENVAIAPVEGRYRQGEGLRLLRIEAENFKSITSKIVNVNGHHLIVAGKNGSGKSSLIQAITGALSSKNFPDVTVKEGEERGHISITIGDDNEEYTINYHFTKDNQKGRVVVTNKEGETVPGPATIIKGFLSSASFDITGWLNEKKEKKLQMLKELTGAAQQIDMINGEIKLLKATRKAKKDRFEELEGALNNHEFVKNGTVDKDAIAKYSVPVDMNALQEEFNVTSQNIQTWHNYNNFLQGLYGQVTASQQKIQASNEKIRQLQEAIAAEETSIQNEIAAMRETEAKCIQGEEWKRKTPMPTLEDINSRMANAIAHNDKYQRIGMLSGQQVEMVNLKAEVEGFKDKIEAQENKRNKIISESQLPVEGLSFTDEEIFYNGLPLDELQQNTTKLFDIGCEIAMALNPKLKLIFLHDASLYDKEHLKHILHLCDTRGYQTVSEIVTQDNDMEAHFAEEFLK